MSEDEVGAVIQVNVPSPLELSTCPAVPALVSFGSAFVATLPL